MGLIWPGSVDASEQAMPDTDTVTAAAPTKMAVNWRMVKYMQRSL
jgi:hypothetical protein